MQNQWHKIRRALISVSDKTHLESLAKVLHGMEIEIIASQGTGSFLKEMNIPYLPIEKVTGVKEAFGGRMKTLSFEVMSSLLFKRDEEGDLNEAKELGIKPIDLVVCNLYPFEKKAQEKSDLTELIENIDIGGPTLLRAGAKNFKYVAVCCTPSHYSELIKEMEENNGSVTLGLREKLALDAFRYTTQYDALISSELGKRWENELPTLGAFPDEARPLRYGENPHQKGWVYVKETQGLANVVPIQGKELSYNNFLDADAALKITSEIHHLLPKVNYGSSVVSIIKHLNPCGVGVGKSSVEALEKAWCGDPVSSFGGVISFNQEVDAASAKWLSEKFVEIVLAPSFHPDALEIFSEKKNLRLLALPLLEESKETLEVRSISGGLLVQEQDKGVSVEFQTISKKAYFPDAQKSLSYLGMAIAKHLKSNAIALVQEDESGALLIGAGMGNPNRLVSLDQAVQKAKENGFSELGKAVCVSDGFFPFADSMDRCQEAGIKYVVQPGGSIRDKYVINACNKFGMAMGFTGRRNFSH